MNRTHETKLFVNYNDISITMKTNLYETTNSDANQASKDDEIKLTLRQQQAMETKEKIYRSALKVINEKGYKNISIEDITKEAGVAKGTFYTHFSTKEDVVAYTYTSSDITYKNALSQMEGKDFLSMIVGFVRIAYAEYEKRGKPILKALISNYFSYSDFVAYGPDRELLKCLDHIVSVGKKEGTLDKKVPQEKYCSSLLAAIIGMEVLWCFDETNSSLATMVENAVRFTAMGMIGEKSNRAS